MVWRKHRPETGSDDIELGIGEGKRLRGCLDPLEIDTCVVRGAPRPASKFSGVRSDATTVAPACAARMATFPVPAATSSTR
jgi:hypothetical protein